MARNAKPATPKVTPAIAADAMTDAAQLCAAALLMAAMAMRADDPVLRAAAMLRVALRRSDGRPSPMLAMVEVALARDGAELIRLAGGTIRPN